MKCKINKKKIGGFFVTGLLLALLSIFLGSVLSQFIEDPIHTKITLDSILANLLNIKSLRISAVIFVGLILIIIYYSIKLGYFGHTAMMNREDRAKSGLHGQARFQTPEEMAKNFGEKESKKSWKAYTWSELYKSDFEGIICHSFKKNGKFYIESCKNVHSLVVGGTGSGKSTSVVGPTIQANANSNSKVSMLIYDLKGDLYKQHAEMLEKQGYKVIVLDLKKPVQSVKYNPLSIIWDLYQDYLTAKAEGDIVEQTNLDTKISNYITDIALKIVPTASGENKVWSEGSQGIIKGLLWGMLEDSTVEGYGITKEKYTLSQISNILNIPAQREQLFNFLQNRPKDSMVFKKSGIILNNESEKTVSSYISNTQSNLEKFTEKGIELVTQKSDFEMYELLEQPTAIFVVIDDTNTATHILCSIFASQLRNYLVLYADTHGGALERTWYFLLDEFANLPKIENFNKWMSTDRSRKVFYCIFLQSISQLKNIFNEEEKNEILNNCTLQVYLKASELQSLQYFQNLFGTYTEYSRSSNINEKSLEAGVYEGSKSLVQRHLVNIDDLQYIEMGNSYFFYAGLPPCKATLIPIFDEELNRNKVFQRGSYKVSQINSYPDFDGCYYDLALREETYRNGGIPLSKPNIYKEDDESGSPLEDVTEDYIVQEVNTREMSTMTHEKLCEILGYADNLKMTDIEPIEEPEEDELEETIEIQKETPIIDEEDDDSDEEEIIEEWDEETQKMIETRYKKTYLSRLIQSPDTVKEYYSKVKNELLSYEKVKSSISSKHELFKKGVKVIAKLTFRGKTLCIYLALDPKTYENTKYHIEDVAHKSQYEKTPSKFKISGTRKLSQCFELIADAMKLFEINKGENQEIDYVSEYPFEETSSLFDKGLIKKVVIEKTLKNSNVKTEVQTSPLEETTSNVNEESKKTVEEVVEEPVMDPVIEENNTKTSDTPTEEILTTLNVQIEQSSNNSTGIDVQPVIEDKVEVESIIEENKTNETVLPEQKNTDENTSTIKKEKIKNIDSLDDNSFLSLVRKSKSRINKRRTNNEEDE